MPKYLSPSQLQAGSLGVDVSAVPYAELNAIIGAAEAQVDSFTATEHQWRAWYQQMRWVYQSRRIYLLSTPTPVKTVDRVRIEISTVPSTGNPFVATISPYDCVVNNTAGWLEVVSLQALTYSLTPVLVNLGLNTILSLTDYHSGYLLSQYGERLQPDSTQKIYSSQRAFWATDANVSPNISPYVAAPFPPVVYANGAVQQASGYTVDYQNGVVTFTAAPGGTVTCDYAYTIPDAIRDATRYAAVQLLMERNANAAGLAGFTTLSLPGQLSAARMPTLPGLPAISQALLQPYRHVSLA